MVDERHETPRFALRQRVALSKQARIAFDLSAQLRGCYQVSESLLKVD
jgi:hypothetical protein